MHKDDLSQMYGLARKLARTYRPYWMDYDDVVQEFVTEGWKAASSRSHLAYNNAFGRDRVHWGYIKKAMYRRFIDLVTMAKRVNDEVVLEETDTISNPEYSVDAITHDLVLQLPEAGEIRETLLALITFPTECECKAQLGVCNNRWTYRKAAAKRYIQENIA